MKKISTLVIVIFLVSTLLATSAIPAVAENLDNTVSQDTGDISQTITDKGIALSVDDFNKSMVGPVSERLPIESCGSYKNVDLQINSMNLNDGTISLDANVKYSGVDSNLSASGKLNASYNAQKGVNSVVADLEDSTGNFKILLFNVFNDTSKDDFLLVRNDLNEKPHLKMYLLDSNGNILFFEIELPKELEQLDAKAFSDGDSAHDLYWFTDIAKPSKAVNVPTDRNTMTKLGVSTIKPLALGEFSQWVNSTTYTYNFYLGNTYIVNMSLPILNYKHVNVNSSDSTWTAAFLIAEHTDVGGTTYYGNNVFRYRNLQINFGCGDKSTFIRTMQQGRVYDYTSLITGFKKVGDSITATLLNKALSTLPYGSTLSTILGYFNTLSSSTGSVTLGSSGVTLSNRKTVAVGEKLSKYELQECTDHDNKTNNGDYFTYQATLQSEGATSSVSTVGALQLKFDVYNNGTSTNTASISHDFQLNYTAMP